jgi:hypothetical protein
MRKFCILLCITAAVSCFNNKTAFDGTVNFEKIKVEKNGSDITADSTYSVSVEYYNPTDAPAYLKDSIMKYTRLLLASWFDVKGQFDPNVSVNKHMEEYFRLVKENNLPDYNAFRLKIWPEEIYLNQHVISFIYNWRIYEGGAHGNFGKFCFVIDKNTGSKVSYESLTENSKAEFLSIAEAEFKAQSGIKEGEEIYSLYRFKNNRFHLTDNYAFTSSGMVFCYNPYEIAPYSFGLIELTLPYEKTENLIKWH